MVLRRCRRLLKNEEAACDAMQEVFLKVLRYRDTLTSQYPSSLLFRIATNVCLNRIRKERRFELKSYLDIFHNLDFFEKETEESTAAVLLDFLLKDEKHTTRNIAVMYFVNGMTIREVAVVLKMSVSGIHKHLTKLRRKIEKRETIHA